MTAATTTLPPRQLSARVGFFQGISQMFTLAWRSTVSVKHEPKQLADISFQPIIFTLLFTFVFGGAISGDRHAYLQFMIPGMLVMSMLFATINVGIGLNTDLSQGVFDRFRSLPIARWAPLAGRIIGDQFKQVWSVLLVVGVGLLLGFRPEKGFLGVLAAGLLLLVFAIAFSWVPTLVGVAADQAEKVQVFAFAVILPLNFVSGVFAPVESMPSWLQAFAEVSPVAILLKACRGLMNGGVGVTSAVVWSLIWAAVIAIVFGALSVRALKKRI